MGNRRKGPAPALVRAAMDFLAAKPWREIDDTEVIALEIPGEPEPVFASVLGSAGIERGLGLHRGPRAYDLLARLIEGAPDDDTFEEWDTLGLTFLPLREIPPARRRILTEAGFAGRREALAPWFHVKGAGKQLREPNRTEAKLFTRALRGILAARERGLLEPVKFESGGDLLVLTISGSAGRPEVEASFRTFGPGATDLPEGPVLAPEGLARLPRIETRWLVGLPGIPAEIAGDDRSVRVLVVRDEEDGLVLKMHAVMSGETGEAASALFAVLLGENVAGRGGRPREIRFSSRTLFDAAAPALEAAGVSCSYRPRIPEVAEVAERFAEETWGGGRAEEEPQARLEAWRRMDETLVFRLMEEVGRDLEADAGPRYFGSRTAFQRFTQGPVNQMAVAALVEWVVFHHRRRGGGGTAAERLLRRGLSAPERDDLIRRSRTPPSIYRIDSLDLAEATLDLEDLIRGGRVTVFDRGLSRSARVGLCLPLRVIEAAGRRIAFLFGPPFPGLLADPAISFLEDQGLELTTEGLLAGAHLFGRLWTWMESSRDADRPRISNTDGEAFELHTAAFSVRDEATLRRALAERPDLEATDDAGWTWFKEGGFGERTLLGRLTLIGEELVLDVNSKERFRLARRFLEAIPGVAFLRVTRRDLDDLPEDDRGGGEESGPPPPEVLEQIGEILRQRWMRWLDESLPALGGRTPREACATEEGRRRVKILIRSLPPSGGPAGTEFPVPREELYRELGLD